MKGYRLFILVTIAFIAVSAILYYIHYLIFHDPHHIFIYMVGDLAFLPLEVFLVVIVIERILSRREKQSIVQKLNMVIGAFFSEVGNSLLRDILRGFESSTEIGRKLAVDQSWSHTDFRNAMAFASGITEKPNLSLEELEQLRTFLVQKRNFLLRLLENPNLLEHEQFTDLLWATFHLTEELEARNNLEGLPESDLGHINGDVQRVYSRLSVEWIRYTEHLQLNYPYLYSLIVRMNPFKEQISPVVA